MERSKENMKNDVIVKPNNGARWAENTLNKLWKDDNRSFVEVIKNVNTVPHHSRVEDNKELSLNFFRRKRL